MPTLRYVTIAFFTLALVACSGRPANEVTPTARALEVAKRAKATAPQAAKLSPAAAAKAATPAQTAAAKATTGAASTSVPAGPPRFTITVIPKGTAHPFWKTVHAGAVKAAKEFNVKINWLGPENEDDRKQQIDLINSVVASGVNALVLAPLDNTALVQPVENAVASKIPVIIIDSALKSDKQSSFIATNNREGGREAARLLGQALGGKGKAIMMRYQVGSASTTEREEGFLEVMAKEFPGIELVSTDQYPLAATRTAAMETGVNLLTVYGGKIQGIFCPNESSASGMLLALLNTGRAASIKFVGFDASEMLIDGMRKGNVQGLVAQDPFSMGYLGVKTAVEVLDGKKVEKQINTNLVKITPANLETKEIQALIAPELQGM
jgi:ribose transport system substrate-binding protein